MVKCVKFLIFMLIWFYAYNYMILGALLMSYLLADKNDMQCPLWE